MLNVPLKWTSGRAIKVDVAEHSIISDARDVTLGSLSWLKSHPEFWSNKIKHMCWKGEMEEEEEGCLE